MVILICILLLGLIALGWWFNSAKYKGKAGEEKVQKILTQLPDNYYLLKDVILVTQNGTTQIDHIVVSKYGVFAIETKNYRGTIYGNDFRDQWTQMIITKKTYESNLFKTYTYVTKNHLYNPVKQSIAHANEIRKYLKQWPRLKVIPIVVFISRADISNVKSNYHVIYENYLLSTILSYKTATIADADVEKVSSLLARKDMRDVIDNKTHVKNVKATKRNYREKIASDICPKCGGDLILRNGKYGKFLGCSNYPKCKFTSNL